MTGRPTQAVRSGLAHGVGRRYVAAEIELRTFALAAAAANLSRVRSLVGDQSSSSVIITHCNKLLGWYPAFAGRYTAAWGKAYGPCKEQEIAAHPGADYYATSMWQVRVQCHARPSSSLPRTPTPAPAVAPQLPVDAPRVDLCAACMVGVPSAGAGCS